VTGGRGEGAEGGGGEVRGEGRSVVFFGKKGGGRDLCVLIDVSEL
jgi:hypothetical protein